MSALARFLATLKMARPQRHANLTVFPLLAPPDDQGPGWVTLGQGLAAGQITVASVAAGYLLLINQDQRPALIVPGQAMGGQGRVVNTAILARAAGQTLIPALCLEPGPEPQPGSRPRAVPPPPAEAAQPWLLRQSLDDDLFRAHRDPALAYERALRPMDCQVGWLWAVGGRVAGLECLGHAKSFAALRGELLAGLIADALGQRSQAGQDRPPEPGAARDFLARAAGATASAHPGVALGQGLAWRAGEASGAALIHHDRLLHLVAGRRRGAGAAH